MNYEDIKDKFQQNFFQINMLLSLIKELKSLNYSNKNNEIYIFFHKGNFENNFDNNGINNSISINNLILMNNKSISEKVISVGLGGEYEFKKLQINNHSITVYLADENGKFILNNIPYDNIIGFYNNKKLVKYYDIFNKSSITLKDIENSILNKINSEKEKYSYIFLYTIENTILNIIKDGLEENQTIKITFVDKTISTNEKYKLLTVVIEDDEWEISLKDHIIYLQINNNDNEVENIEIPLKNIMTFLDTKNLILFNRYLKFMEEDFQDIDFSVSNQENLFFVDFNSLLEDEMTNEFTNLFKGENLFSLSNISKNQKKNVNKNIENKEDNLIIGNFDVKDKKD
jgi:hypothetical protein